ncbi:BnaA08g30640D [Brassica napus]|uniref:2Fe-2S ferredoxin n=3 Tax=Brassica TaxID=3705 RepID=A0A078J830_BRANA|nr:BnaA08g30640D [Brassica napus]
MLRLLFFLSKCSGACEGSLACSTCHVIVGKANSLFSCNKLIINQQMKRYDMLDLAFGLTKMSRLGCQVIQSQIARWIDGLVPKPH